ncbi:hypothetical protein ON010_g1709 [Phytophthora cinnamomi]|nr:hypothetical protein ON010_g1709 [Phytophthora cinnamomi]
MGISSNSRREHRYSPSTIVTLAATRCTSHQSHIFGNSCKPQTHVSREFRPPHFKSRRSLHLPTHRIETLHQEVDEVERHAEVEALLGALHEERETHRAAQHNTIQSELSQEIIPKPTEPRQPDEARGHNGEAVLEALHRHDRLRVVGEELVQRHVGAVADAKHEPLCHVVRALNIGHSATLDGEKGTVG